MGRGLRNLAVADRGFRTPTGAAGGQFRAALEYLRQSLDSYANTSRERARISSITMMATLSAFHAIPFMNAAA